MALYVSRRRPASGVALSYLARRPERAIPTALVIALVTLLLVVVITPGNTFRSTLDANLAALDVVTFVAPAQRARFDSDLREVLDRNGAAERWTPVHATWVRYPVMIGEGSCPLILVGPEETQTVLERLALTLAAGRMPVADRPTIVLHEAVARARGLHIGDRIGSLVDPDDAFPGSFEIVGLARGRARAAVGVNGSGLLTSMLEQRLPAFAMVYARAGRKEASDRYLHEARDGSGPAFEVIDRAYARQRADRALRNLPLLVRFVSISSAAIVALIVVLLTLLAVQSRVPEFAIQIALGVRLEVILASLLLELFVVAVASWLLGAALGIAGLAIYDAAALRPRGILIHVWDPSVLLGTAVVPVLTVGAGAVALYRALHGIDPVAAILRRAA